MTTTLITITAPDVETRKPLTWLNYPRNVLGAIEVLIADGGSIGPASEPIYPVTATYDEKDNRTRVGFSYLPPKVTP